MAEDNDTPHSNSNGSDTTRAIARNGDRHSHIGIRLQYRRNPDDKWAYLEALGWNAVGFNFHHADDLPGAELELRRGLTRFTGTLAWQSINTSDEVVLGTVVNRLLYTRTQEVATADPHLQTRLLKLLRVPGMVDDKLKILASLGPTVSLTHMTDLVAQRKREHPVYHYGVRVQSQAWASIVDNALSVSSVLVSLDKWSGALGGNKPQ